MVSEKVNRWLQLSGNLAVLVGLILVWVEIRQSNDIAMTVAQQSIMDNFTYSHDVALDEETGLAAFRAKLRTANLSDLDPTEQERAFLYVVRYWNSYTSVQVAYNQGMIEEDLFHGFIEDLRLVMDDYPATKEIWVRQWRSYPNTQSWEIWQPIANIADNY